VTSLKEKLFAQCVLLLKNKIAQVKDAIALQREANTGESKSSAGDKYETGVAMTHLELEKLGNQLNLLENDLNKLLSFEKTPVNTQKVIAGSLVSTANGVFWISVGLGALSVDNQNVYVISPISPIAQIVLHKAVGFTFQFNGKPNQILAIS